MSKHLSKMAILVITAIVMILVLTMNSVALSPYIVLAQNNNINKQRFEDIQRANQQRFNCFWRPFMGQQQQDQEQERAEE